MAKQTINIGSAANDGTGDGLRTAFTKVNANFTELYNFNSSLSIPTDISQLTDTTHLLGAAANTGDVTFTGNIIQGTGYELSLSPGTDFTTGNYTQAPGPQLGPQYFRFRGGDNYEHLHFDTSNNSAFDLYVGDDNKYVKLSKDGPIVIGTNGLTWDFNPDGNLKVPAGKNINWGQNGDTLGPPIVAGGRDRLTLWDFEGGGSNFNYAIGAEGSHVWFTMDVNNKTGGFKFYSRDNEVFTIRDDGALIYRDNNLFNVVDVPTSSTGQAGDEIGYVAFNSSYLYYCTGNYNQTGHQITVATAYNGATSLNTNSFQLTKTADTEQISVGDTISDSDGGATSTVVSVSSDSNYTYVGTGGMAYNAVFPLTFTSTSPAYIPGGNIWKRVAWSAGTW